jgi:hypothetical protein
VLHEEVQRDDVDEDVDDGGRMCGSTGAGASSVRSDTRQP